MQFLWFHRFVSKRHSPFAITFCMFVPRSYPLFCVFPVVDRQCLVLARQCRRGRLVSIWSINTSNSITTNFLSRTFFFNNIHLLAFILFLHNCVFTLCVGAFLEILLKPGSSHLCPLATTLTSTRPGASLLKIQQACRNS